MLIKLTIIAHFNKISLSYLELFSSVESISSPN